MCIQIDVIRVLQGKLGGCIVNSQDVILNHTTYYLNPDVHTFNKATLFLSNYEYYCQEVCFASTRLTHLHRHASGAQLTVYFTCMYMTAGSFSYIIFYLLHVPMCDTLSK